MEHKTTNNAAAQLQEFAKKVHAKASELKAQVETTKFHMQAKTEMANRYNVSETLFRGSSFWIECARKAVIRGN